MYCEVHFQEVFYQGKVRIELSLNLVLVGWNVGKGGQPRDPAYSKEVIEQDECTNYETKLM